MKLRSAIILFAAIFLIGSCPALAQGIIEGDSSLSFHGVSQMWASERDIIQPVEGDLDMLRRLRDQSLITGSSPTVGGGPVFEFSRLNPDTISKGLPPLPKTDLQTPTIIPEPSSLALIALGTSCLALFRRQQR